MNLSEVVKVNRNNEHGRHRCFKSRENKIGFVIIWGVTLIDWASL